MKTYLCFVGLYTLLENEELGTSKCHPSIPLENST